MTDTPTTDPLVVENTILRGTLFLATSVLRDYHDAPHGKTERLRRTVTIPEGLRERAGDAIARAERLLEEPERDAATEPPFADRVAKDKRGRGR